MTGPSRTAAIDLVAADDAKIDAVRVGLPATGLGCVVELDNATPETFTPSDYLPHAGQFRLDPVTVDPFDHMVMSATGEATGGGVEGAATFQGRGITITITFTNPTHGIPDAGIELSGPRTAEFSARAASSGRARIVHHQYLVSHPVDDRWRFCGRCHGLFNDEHHLAHPHCPGGTNHVAIGPRFVLLHGVPNGPQLQAGWHVCTRCNALFLVDGDPHNQLCGAGGHHHAGRTDFAVPHDLPAVRLLTSGWRQCRECHGLFFDGPEYRNRRCATGALHRAIGWAFGLPTQSPWRSR